ncbi:MAG: sulfatase-like hydrolase/transferase, partial [Chloroflexi bacterium]|nr:sulfatase-like hydrolase/transferase [Chloroflexota bacterium]
MRKPLVIHPILIAVFPALFFYAHNIKETATNQVLIPLGASLTLALLFWALFSRLLKTSVKAGLATSIFVFVLLTYGHFYTLLEKYVFVPGHGYLLPGALLVSGYCVYFVQCARRDFRTITSALNLAAAALVSINLFTIVSYELRTPQTPPRTEATEHATSKDLNSMPDIYFIILDEYAHPDIMGEYYNYDNSRFLESLKNKGFFIAQDSRTHNSETIRAIASILNMEFTPETELEAITYQRITSNKVVDYLRSIGYRFIYFGQWYEEGRYPVEADSYFNFYEASGYAPLTSEFSATFWNTTALRPFYNYIAGERYEGYYRDGLLRTLDYLKRVPDTEGPKFVYAHIMAPHAPFVFGPNGERTAPSNFYNFSDKQYYLGQY